MDQMGEFVMNEVLVGGEEVGPVGKSDEGGGG